MTLLWLAIGNFGRWLVELADRHREDRHLVSQIKETW